MRKNPPSYRHHKASGQAIVKLSGRTIYLGPYDSEASRRAYDRAVAEWLSAGRVVPADDAPTVAEVAEAYHRHVAERYRSNEPGNILAALKPLVALYGDRPAATFGPLALQAVRIRHVEAGIVRPRVNRRVQMIVRMFKWAVSQQLVPPSTWEALRSLEGIPKGTKGAKEPVPVRPVADAWVEAVLPHVSRQVAAMIRLQRLTGMRPGEVVIMRTCDLATAGKVWEYRPSEHKLEHRGIERIVYVGPTAQDVLRPFLRPALAECLFSPKEAEVERLAALRAARKTKVQPSQEGRAVAGRIERLVGDRYTTDSYRRAIEKGVNRANAGWEPGGRPRIPSWTPNQLRHSAATQIRREFGLDVAQVVLGHSTPDTTTIYAEVDAAKARAAMERLG